MILCTFPERTQSMIDTLHSVNKWIEKTHFSGKSLLIAGDSHLKTLEEMHGDPRSSLTTLYKALEKYEAVVLIPRFIPESDSHRERTSLQSQVALIGKVGGGFVQRFGDDTRELVLLEKVVYVIAKLCADVVFLLGAVFPGQAYFEGSCSAPCMDVLFDLEESIA